MINRCINNANLKWNHWVILLFLLVFLNACRTENIDVTSSQPTTITFAAHSFDRSNYESLIQKFQEQNSNIIVQYVSLEDALGEQVANANMRQLASLADVVLLDGKPSNEALTYFMNLEPLLSADNSFAPDELWPGLLSGCQTENTLTGIPIGVAANLIFFDGNAFTEANLPYPQPSWTWGDFQQVAQQLTQEAGTQKQYGFVTGGRSIFLLGSLSNELTDSEGNLDVGLLDSQLGWYIDLVQAGVIYADTSTTAQGANRDTLIAQGDAAMWLGGHFELSRMRDNFGNAVGILPFPISPTRDLDSTTPLRASCAMISAGTQNSEAAWTWINFLTQQIPATSRGDMPVRSSVADANGYWANWDAESVETLKFALTHGWYGDYASPLLRTVGEAVDQVLSDGVPFSEAFPDIIEVPPTPAPPITSSTPVVVATPRATSTPVTVNVPAGEAIVVEYYADLTVHHSREAVEALAKEFNEVQNRIQVNLFTARPDFQGTYGIAEMSEAYDCFAWNAPATAFPQAMEDRFYSLEALWAGEDTAIRDDINRSLVEQNRIAGELYALPVSSQPYVVYYNANRFEDLSLDRPLPDWTVDDFWSLAVASSGREDSQIYGFVPNIWSTMDLLLLTPQSPTLFDMNTTPLVVMFDNPEIIQAVNWLDSMVDTGMMFAKDQTTLTQIQQQNSLITTGQAAMWIDLAGANRYSFEIGVVPIPVTSEPLPVANSTSAYISRRAVNPTGCWEWIKFLSANPDAFQGVPVRESILNSPEWIAVVGEESAVAYRATLSRPVRTETALDNPNLYVPFPFFVWWEEALQTIFAGGDSAEVLGDMQVRAETYLQCIMSNNTRDFDTVNDCAKQADPSFSPDF